MKSLIPLCLLAAPAFAQTCPPAADHSARLAEIVADLQVSRGSREAQILAGLAAGPSSAAALTDRIYHDVPAVMHPAARRNVLAHLIDLAQKGTVTPDGALTENTRFRLL